jgi:putative multiple sugar transport system ATP-binding protein
VPLHTIKDSERMGIVIIHQELALVPYLSIAENMFFGQRAGERQRGELGPDLSEMRRVHAHGGPARKSAHLGQDIGMGKQQLAEIAKRWPKTSNC